MTLQDVLPGFLPVSVQLSTAALSSTTASAGQLSGSFLTIMTNTGGTPGTYTTRTAAQMIADSNLYVGQTYFLILANNQGTGTLTLAGGSNVTVGGTATAAINTARLFTVTVGGTIASPTITITGLALAWTSAV
jgi:hypothetical protein